MILSAGYASAPLRAVLSKMFATEREARILSTLQEALPKASLLGQFVNTHFPAVMENMDSLLDDDSFLHRKMCGGTPASICRNRSFVLRGFRSGKAYIATRFLATTCFQPKVDL